MGAKGQAAIKAGGLVVDVFHDNTQMSGMTAWIQAENLYVSVVRVKDTETIQELVSREWTYVVDLKTMKIVWKGFGSYDGSKPSSAEEGLNQLTTLLGP